MPSIRQLNRAKLLAFFSKEPMQDGFNYVDPVIRAFVDRYYDAGIYSQEDFDPKVEWERFITSYAKKKFSTKNKPKRLRAGRPANFEITEEERKIAAQRLKEEKTTRRQEKDRQGSPRHRSYVSKGFWPRLADELRPNAPDGYMEALRSMVTKPPNPKKKLPKTNSLREN